MSIKASIFGKTRRGEVVTEYTMSSSTGARVSILSYGGIMRELIVPDKNGKLTDVLLGYNSLEEYEAGDKYFGAICGRYANRIAGGHFSLSGREYQVNQNEGNNTLHGGLEGFNQKCFDGEISGDSLILRRISPDGEEGFPGNLSVTLTYTLTGNALELDVMTSCDQETIANIVNHNYFNLNGQGSGDILKHTLQINAACYCPSDRESIPTQEPAPVEGTPFDFREPTEIGLRIDEAHEQLIWHGGYDHNYDVRKRLHIARAAADLSGIVLDVYSDLPGVQFYTGNFIGDTKGKGGASYQSRHGFCLEAQQFPNAVNVDCYPSPILKAGEIKTSHLVYAFSAE